MGLPTAYFMEFFGGYLETFAKTEMQKPK